MFANLTAESYAELKVSSPKVARALANDPAYRTVIIDFTAKEVEANQARLQVIADSYDNGELWPIAGQKYEFYQVVEIALNTLTYRKNNAEYEAHTAKYPAIYARKAEAWGILHAIKEAKEGFSLKTEDLRELVEQRLSK
jgi:hypothetical protein